MEFKKRTYLHQADLPRDAKGFNGNGMKCSELAEDFSPFLKAKLQPEVKEQNLPPN